MEDREARIEKIHSRIKKLLSLQVELNLKLAEMESVNQLLHNKIRTLEAGISQLKNEKINLDEKNQNNNHFKKQEINHKINELLSEIERSLTLLKK